MMTGTQYHLESDFCERVRALNKYGNGYTTVSCQLCMKWSSHHCQLAHRRQFRRRSLS